MDSEPPPGQSDPPREEAASELDSSSSDDSGQKAEGSGFLPANWIDDHADALFRFALTRVSDQHVIEDLLQETYLAAYKSLSSFRRESSLRTWLIAILRLKIADYYRVQARRAKKEKEVQPVQNASFRELRLTAWNCDPRDTVEKDEFWAVFHSCIEKLPATLSRAFLMREIDGCDCEQVCGVLGISSENLAVRTFRARAAMRDCLDLNWFTKE